MKTKKIILFIVEGVSDKNSLALILSKLIKTERVLFHIVGGDITSNRNTTVQNCINKVNDEINKFLKVNRFRKSDIINVIHLVDTDGAYIKEDSIAKSDLGKVRYTEKEILTCKVENIIERNEKKSSILNKLSTKSDISNINYRMYYFSCNLEHVLHNEQNLDDNLKSEYSDRFEDKYYGNEKEFIRFISEGEFAVGGSYEETWEHIKSGLNSLNRYSNFHLFFSEITNK